MKDEGTPEQGMNLSSPTPSPIEGAKAVRPDASWTGIQLVEYAKGLLETARKLEKQAGVVYWDSCDALRLAQEAFHQEGRTDWVRTVEEEVGPYSTVHQMIRVANALTRQQADGLGITEIKVKAGIIFVKDLSDPGNGGDKPTRKRRTKKGKDRPEDDAPDDGAESDEADSDDGGPDEPASKDNGEPGGPDSSPGPQAPESKAPQVDLITLEQATEVVAKVADAVTSQPPLAEEARLALARVTMLEKTVNRLYMALLKELLKTYAQS
jgi:hypothetical protein